MEVVYLAYCGSWQLSLHVPCFCAIYIFNTTPNPTSSSFFQNVFVLVIVQMPITQYRSIPVFMEQTTAVYVKYVGSLWHWKDAIFNVPITNITKASGSGDPHLPPLVGDRVIVQKASRSGHIRKWNGIVVSEVDLVEEKRLLEVNEIIDNEKLDADSPGPPGSVTPSPQHKRSRLQGIILHIYTFAIMSCIL